MADQINETTKKNVGQFEDDVRRTGSYAYTADVLSARYANARISKFIQEAYDFRGKTVLDLGCGDGAYTLEFPGLGVRKIVGVDPASAAIDAANAKSKALGLDGVATFAVGNIYALDEYLADPQYDCIVLRGVLHHLPDAAKAIAGLASFKGTIVILEPNGNNPVLKLLEKYSRYHVEHEERSFSPALIRSWLREAGFQVHHSKVLNLVPMFCPDWLARSMRIASPVVERIPLLRDIGCGQVVIAARR